MGNYAFDYGIWIFQTLFPYRCSCGKQHCSATFFVQTYFYTYVIFQFLEACIAFIGGMWMYLYIYGTIRSFNVRRYGIVRFVLFLLAGVLVTPFKICVETVAVIWGLFTPKHKFFIVQKELASVETVWTC